MLKRELYFFAICSMVFSLSLFGNPNDVFAANTPSATGQTDISIPMNNKAASNIGSSGEDGVNSESVPPWIKTSMQFWVEGHTSDAEFLNAVEFLANERIIQVDEKQNMGEVIPKLEIEQTANAQAGAGDAGTVQTEILSMDLSSHDSFFDIFYESYTVDSFFDIFTEMQHTTDSFFDVFFDVETPRTNDCLRGQELVFDERSSSWQCSSANTVDSFFDVFFDVATESAENSDDIAELERKVAELERKIAQMEGSSSGNVETEFKVEKGE